MWLSPYVSQTLCSRWSNIHHPLKNASGSEQARDQRAPRLYIVRGAGRSERGAMWVTAALTEPTDTTAAAAAAANETPMPS